MRALRFPDRHRDTRTSGFSTRLLELDLQTLAASFPDPVVHVRDGIVAWASPAMESATGWCPERLQGIRYEALAHPDDRRNLKRHAARVLSGEPSLHRFRLMARGATCHWVEGHASPLSRDGRQLGFIETMRVVDESVAEEAELRRLAHLDALTGLPNRVEAMRRIAAATAYVRRSDAGKAVLFCDLDGFKQVNDALGHLAGDALLRQVATRVRMSLRDEDLAARVGGDEFVVLLERVDGLTGAREVARKIHTSVAAPFVVAGCTIHPRMSIGVAMLEAGSTAHEALAAADAAMYEAKRGGPSTVMHG